MSTLIERAREADVLLLGELHDNPRHHAGRAAVLSALPATVVVVEYLQRGEEPVLPASADADVLRAILEADGFDAKGWHWPLHEPLFKAMALARHELQGGNLPRRVVRTVAEGGGLGPACPATLGGGCRAAVGRCPRCARAATSWVVIAGI